MTLSYEKIYSRFLQKIQDVDFLQLDRNTAYEKMAGWLHSAVSVPYTKRIFETIVMNDDIMTIEYGIRHPEDEESDDDYVAEVLANGMLIEWLTPMVETTLSTKQGYFGKEQKYYSQASHLSSTMTLLELTQKRWRKLIQDRGYIHNSYLEDET